MATRDAHASYELGTTWRKGVPTVRSLLSLGIHSKASKEATASRSSRLLFWPHCVPYVFAIMARLSSMPTPCFLPSIGLRIGTTGSPKKTAVFKIGGKKILRWGEIFKICELVECKHFSIFRGLQALHKELKFQNQSILHRLIGKSTCLTKMRKIKPQLILSWLQLEHSLTGDGL